MCWRQISLIVGLMYVTVGVLRLGFLTNFLSRSVIAGFTCGAAIVIGVSQVRCPKSRAYGDPSGTIFNERRLMLDVHVQS